MESQEIKSWLDAAAERVSSTVQNLFAITKPGAIFSEPIRTEGVIAITASEVVVGAGMGIGGGGAEDNAKQTESTGPAAGIGAGGGGGGYSFGRPVAMIAITGKGVEVTPIVDVTKVGLAFLTMLGAVLMMMLRVRREEAHRITKL